MKYTHYTETETPCEMELKCLCKNRFCISDYSDLNLKHSDHKTKTIELFCTEMEKVDVVEMNSNNSVETFLHPGRNCDLGF